MADFSVPILPIGGLDTTIAKGPDLSWLGNLPNAYWQGQDQAFKSRNQDLFQAGLPRDANGNIDWNKASQMALKAGGAAAIPEAVAVGNLQGGQAVLDASRAIDRQSGSLSPLVQDGASATPETQAQPGSATLRQIAQARNLDLNQLVQATKLNPDTPLDFNQRQQIAPLFRSEAPAEEPQAQPATFGQRFAAAGPQQSFPPSTSGPPAQAVQPQQQQQAQAQPQAQPQAVPGARPPALPAQVQQMEQRAQQLENLARQKSYLATAAGQYGRANEQKALTDEADRLGKAALSVRESMQRMMEPTQEEKNANNPAVLGFERNKKVQELDLARADKVYGGIQAQASQYERDLKPYTELGTAVLSDPRTYTGIGANAVLDFNKVRSVFGAPQAAMMQEAVQKLTAASVLSQINTQKDQMQEAGSNSSRLFSSQVDQVEKASANMSNTIFGNRFLSSVQQHMGETASEIARQARDYKQAHGALDVGFDNQVSKYLEKHPVFSDLERAHPDVLGAPTLPPGASKWSPEQYVAWGRSLGLKPGDSVRISNGRYGTIPKVQ